MRWFTASALALIAAWCIFLVSPYWAMRDLAMAVEARDAAELSTAVNFRALRQSMAKQLVTELAESDRSGTIGPSTGTIAAAALAAAIDPLLERILTADGVASLLGAPSGGGRSSIRPPIAEGASRFDRIAEFLRASSWRGFRTVYFALPPGAPRDARFRLQLRFSRLAWRLVGVELPVDSRRQIAQAVLAEQRGTEP